MTTFSIEKLANEPIIISTAFPEWRAVMEMDTFLDHLTALLDTCDEPVEYVADLTDWHPDLPDIIAAANKAARSANAVLHHPSIREFLLVTPLRVVELAGKGLNSNAFGHVNVVVFRTLEEALKYARSAYRRQAV